MPLVIAIIIIFAVVYISIDNSRKSHAFSGKKEPGYRKTNGRYENIRFMEHYFNEGHSLEVAHSMAVNDIIGAGFEPCIPVTIYQKLQQDIKQKFIKKPESVAFLLGENELEKYDCYWVSSARKKYINSLTLSELRNHYIENPYVKEEHWEGHGLTMSPESAEFMFREQYHFANPEWVEERVKVLRKWWQKEYSDSHKSTYLYIPDEAIYSDWPSNNYEWDVYQKKQILQTSLKKVGSWCTYPDMGTCEVVDIEYNYDKTKAHYKLKQMSSGNIFSVKSNDAGLYWLNH